MRISLRTRFSAVATAVLAMLGTAVWASPAHAAGPLVAVLPNATGQCPAGSSVWQVYQDNEDDGNANNRFGWIGGIASTSNTRFRLCGVDGDRFRPLLSYRVNFAVLALGPTCPAGAITFDRYVDDEDDNGQSHSTVPAGSGTGTRSGPNTNFRFCWFLNYATNAPPATGGVFPNLGGAYGGFGPSNQPFVLDSGFVRTDDEDDGNANRITPLDPTRSYYRGLWLSETSNTTMRIVRVK